MDLFSLPRQIWIPILVMMVVASNAPVYTRCRLLVADGPQAPSTSTQLRPMHKPPLASAGIYWAGKDSSGGAAPGGRTMATGHTTASHWLVVSKCAFSRGPIKRAEHPGHPWTLPLRSSPAGRSPPFLTAPFCHKRTASQCNVGVVKPPFIHYIPEDAAHQGRQRKGVYQSCPFL